MSISENIKHLRESHGMTQAQFGDIAGVTDKAVSTWESGKKEPRMGAIEKISQYFGISKSELLFGDGDNLHRLIGGWGTSSFIVETLLENPPSLDVVAPLFSYYGKTFPADDLTALERELVHRYRRAPQNIKDAVDAVLAPYGEQAANPASSEQSVG